MRARHSSGLAKTAALSRPRALMVALTQRLPRKRRETPFLGEGPNLDCFTSNRRDARRCSRILVGLKALASVAALFQLVRPVPLTTGPGLSLSGAVRASAPAADESCDVGCEDVASFRP